MPEPTNSPRKTDPDWKQPLTDPQLDELARMVCRKLDEEGGIDAAIEAELDATEAEPLSEEEARRLARDAIERASKNKS